MLKVLYDYSNFSDEIFKILKHKPVDITTEVNVSHLLPMLIVLQSSQQVDKHGPEQPVVIVPLLWTSTHDNNHFFCSCWLYCFPVVWSHGRATAAIYVYTSLQFLILGFYFVTDNRVFSY